MPRLHRELNPEILKEHLPDNYLDVLNQAERNVNRAVDQLIGDYEKHLESLAKQLEEGMFPKELQATISKLQETLTTDLSPVQSSADEIKKRADRLESETGGGTLEELAKELASEAANLQTLLGEARKKVQKVSDSSGKVLGTALGVLIKGGF